MPITRGTEAMSPLNLLAEIPTERLAFVAAIFFLIGSGISMYIAYKNLKTSSPTLPVSDQAVLR
ncbi:hypothetical protein ACDX78_04945 [Virgibacillus oceani]